MRLCGGTGDGVGAQQARVVRRAQFIKQKTIRKTLQMVLDAIHSIGGEDMYQAAKMMIASDGRRSAVLLDGVMIGVGVDGIRLDVKEGVAELSITGIDVERFRAGNEADFERFCTGSSGDELGGE